MKSISKFRLPPDAVEAFLDAVYEALVKRGYVKVNEAKVTYALPATQL